MPDQDRHTNPGVARPAPTRFSLTLDDVSHLFEEAGLPRNPRTLQRYCAAGRLDAIKEETVTGLAYFVDPASVERAIKQLAQLHGLTDEVRPGATSQKMSHPDAPYNEPMPAPDAARPSEADRDVPPEELPERPSPAQPDMSRIVELLENTNASLREQTDFYRRQIDVKDSQIAALLERDRGTNFLVRGLQTMLAPLLGRGRNRDDINGGRGAEHAETEQI